MDYNDRELFIYRIICGEVRTTVDGKMYKILPPTADIYLDAVERYFDVYHECCISEKPIRTQDEMVEYMIEQDLWSYHEQKELDQAKEKIEELKLLCYQKRYTSKDLNITRRLLRSVEDRHKDLSEKKNRFYATTADGIAAVARISYIIEHCTYCDGEQYDFNAEDSIPLESIVLQYNKLHDIEDDLVRFLARTEPWRSKWITRADAGKPLFKHPDRELTVLQKSIIAWSRMYDNVYESMECPDKHVIEDDDLLDGWFIHQNQVREKKTAQDDLERSIKSDKIKGSDELFQVVDNETQFNRINSLNNPIAIATQKKRNAVIKQKGRVAHVDLPDQRRKIQMQANNTKGP